MTNDMQKPPTLNYPQCSKQKREFHQGALTVVVCRNRRSPNYRNFVDPEHCDACPLRDGEAAATITPPTPDPAAYTAGQPRPDLAAIQLTLPAPDGKDRTFARPVFEPDGAITYPKREEDWEQPQNINGYVRDPNNPWRFLPLWLPCTLRYQLAFLKANCGCIDIIMRCNNPQAPAYSHRLDDTACKECPHRR
jgi:hypothetical protein